MNINWVYKLRRMTRVKQYALWSETFFLTNNFIKLKGCRLLYKYRYNYIHRCNSRLLITYVKLYTYSFFFHDIFFGHVCYVRLVTLPREMDFRSTYCSATKFSRHTSATSSFRIVFHRKYLGFIYGTSVITINSSKRNHN